MADSSTNECDLLVDNTVDLQKEELEALEAIYGEDFQLENDNGEDSLYGYTDANESNQAMSSVMPTFSISIRADNADNEIPKTDIASASSQRHEARLIISFQPGYPLTCPPIYQLSIPWLRGGQKQLIADALEELYVEHLGESIVYIWVEKIRELLREKMSMDNEISSGVQDVSTPNYTSIFAATGGNIRATAGVSVDPDTTKELIDRFPNSLSFNHAAGDGNKDGNDGSTSLGDSCGGPSVKVDNCKSQHQPISLGVPQIRTGAPLTDRKSTFQAHVAPVNSSGEIRLVLDELYQNKKIASATHNMYAYRILKTDSKTCLQDCDDDGETHAGSRLLHLLQILDCRNVIVVVSRWYGGIQLHADRFKHINNVARKALVEFGFVSSTDGKKTEDLKSKKSSGKR